MSHPDEVCQSVYREMKQLIEEPLIRAAFAPALSAGLRPRSRLPPRGLEGNHDVTEERRSGPSRLIGGERQDIGGMILAGIGPIESTNLGVIAERKRHLAFANPSSLHRPGKQAL